MPIPPQPRTFLCNVCDWHGTTIPLSDCLVMGVDWYSHCPKCSNETLECRAATRTEIMRTRLNDFLQRRHD
ncbi:conserved hypothetical protein [Pseudomonas sp. 8Z]|nr:conserved hypothetical protein [Pseudomonas sp. 8Z]